MKTWEKYNQARYVDAVKMTRFALEQLGSSDKLYQNLGQPLISRVDSALSAHIVVSYKEANPEWEDEHEAGDIIRYGVRDTQALMYPFLTRSTSKESAHGFVHHDITLRNLGIAAMRAEDEFEALVRRVERDMTIPTDPPHLTLPPGTVPTTSGCPAAAVGQKRLPAKEFTDLSVLSGDVLVEALDHHGRFRG